MTKRIQSSHRTWPCKAPDRTQSRSVCHIVEVLVLCHERYRTHISDFKICRKPFDPFIWQQSPINATITSIDGQYFGRQRLMLISLKIAQTCAEFTAELWGHNIRMRLLLNSYRRRRLPHANKRQSYTPRRLSSCRIALLHSNCDSSTNVRQLQICNYRFMSQQFQQSDELSHILNEPQQNYDVILIWHEEC
jgi:hypothetical protein